jgi:ABC-type transporter Mla MlaB component
MISELHCYKWSLMKLEAKNAVLRVAIRSTEDKDTWILQGRLAGEAVSELTTAWKKQRGERSGRKTVVDLVDLTFVDERGESALMEMMVEGAKFVVRGLYTRTLVEILEERRQLGA